MTLALIIVIVFMLAMVLLQNYHTRKVIMSALTDLQQADAAEGVQLSTVSQALQDAIARIGTITIPPTVSDADAAAITADINAHTAALQTIAAALGNIAPSPMAPAPTS